MWRRETTSARVVLSTEWEAGPNFCSEICRYRSTIQHFDAIRPFDIADLDTWTLPHYHRPKRYQLMLSILDEHTKSVVEPSRSILNYLFAHFRLGQKIPGTLPQHAKVVCQVHLDPGVLKFEAWKFAIGWHLELWSAGSNFTSASWCAVHDLCAGSLVFDQIQGP
jgi:hypothetical protein